jgi:hypothetical protein
MEIAISIRQPWAALIVLGFKDIENRTWKPPARYLGETVLIHAGVRPDQDALEFPRQSVKEAATRLAAHCGVLQNFKHMAYHFPDAFKMGGIVGSAIIHSARLNGSISLWASQQPGTWHWHLVAGSTCPFIPCRGQLGFFKTIVSEQVPSRPPRVRQGSLLD